LGKGNHMKVYISFAIIIGIGIAMIAGLVLKSPDPAGEAILRGQIIYRKSCAACHGANLEGQENWRIANEDGTMPAPPHNGEGHTWHHDDQLLFDYTKFGGAGAMAALGMTDFKSGMPAFEDTLTDEDINNVWAFIKSTWTDKERSVQAERNAAKALVDG